IGGNCVPQSECGRVHQGSYYLPKENFWIGEQCQEKCVCQPKSKKVLCAQSPCLEGGVCKVLNGVLGCHVDAPGMCVAKGNTHYTTFDGRNFDVNCTSLLTSHCPSWGGSEDFNEEIQNQMKDGANASFRYVKMIVSGFSTELSHDWSNKVKVGSFICFNTFRHTVLSAVSVSFR
uniref:VWFD domain-containing protein n=1 Tax=Stegastes partitus TaxID=144197 RepID=A0A3B4Z2M0_9TELE